MRVLQVHCRHRDGGGEDVVVEAEADALTRAGHEVHTHLVTNPDTVVRSALSFAGAPWNPLARRRLGEVLRATRPDVVHLHNTWFALSPSVVSACRSARVPVVVTLHNFRLACANSMLLRDGQVCTDCIGTHPWHGVAHACYRGSRAASAVAASTIALHRRLATWSEGVDAFVSATHHTADLLALSGLPRERIEVVAPVLSTVRMPRSNTPERSHEVLFVGRLEAAKGVDILLRAWSEARPTGLRLVLVGDGPLREAAERTSGAEVIGWQDHDAVVARMRSSRALVFPSTWFETFGLVLSEAMSVGLGIVASDIGPRREVLGDAGLLVPPGDVAAWSDALRSLVDDDLVRALGAASDTAFGRLDQALAVRSLVAVYERARERAATTS